MLKNQLLRLMFHEPPQASIPFPIFRDVKKSML